MGYLVDKSHTALFTAESRISKGICKEWDFTPVYVSNRYAKGI